MVTSEEHGGVKRADKRLHATLHSLVDKTLNKKLNSFDFENRLLRKIEKATPPCREAKKVTQATLEDQYFIAQVATFIKRETKKAVDNRSEREDQRRKFVEIPYRTGTWSAASSDQLATDISDE